MIVYVKQAERSVLVADDGYVYRYQFGPRIGRVTKQGTGWLAERLLARQVFASRQKALRWLLEKAEGI